jgi:hypothetical protein
VVDDIFFVFHGRFLAYYELIEDSIHTFTVSGRLGGLLCGRLNRGSRGIFHDATRCGSF